MDSIDQNNVPKNESIQKRLNESNLGPAKGYVAPKTNEHVLRLARVVKQRERGLLEIHNVNKTIDAALGRIDTASDD